MLRGTVSVSPPCAPCSRLNVQLTHCPTKAPFRTATIRADQSEYASRPRRFNSTAEALLPPFQPFPQRQRSAAFRAPIRTNLCPTMHRRSAYTATALLVLRYGPALCTVGGRPCSCCHSCTMSFIHVVSPAGERDLATCREAGKGHPGSWNPHATLLIHTVCWSSSWSPAATLLEPRARKPSKLK